MQHMSAEPTLKDIEKQLAHFFKKRNNLAEPTRKNYISIMRKYSEFLGYTIEEMIE